jgi:hypothetical protein
MCYEGEGIDKESKKNEYKACFEFSCPKIPSFNLKTRLEGA